MLQETIIPLYHGPHGKEEPERRHHTEKKLLSKTPQHGKSTVRNICKIYSTIDETGRCPFKHVT